LFSDFNDSVSADRWWSDQSDGLLNGSLSSAVINEDPSSDNGGWACSGGGDSWSDAHGSLARADNGSSDGGNGWERGSAVDGSVSGASGNREDGCLFSIAASVSGQIFIDSSVIIVIESVSDFLIDFTVTIVINTISWDSGRGDAWSCERGKSCSSDVPITVITSESVTDDLEWLNWRRVSDPMISSWNIDSSIDVTTRSDGGPRSRDGTLVEGETRLFSRFDYNADPVGPISSGGGGDVIVGGELVDWIDVDLEWIRTDSIRRTSLRILHDHSWF